MNQKVLLGVIACAIPGIGLTQFQAISPPQMSCNQSLLDSLSLPRVSQNETKFEVVMRRRVNRVDSADEAMLLNALARHLSPARSIALRVSNVVHSEPKTCGEFRVIGLAVPRNNVQVVDTDLSGRANLEKKDPREGQSSREWSPNLTPAAGIQPKHGALEAISSNASQRVQGEDSALLNVESRLGPDSPRLNPMSLQKQSTAVSLELSVPNTLEVPQLVPRSLTTPVLAIPVKIEQKSNKD